MTPVREENGWAFWVENSPGYSSEIALANLMQDCSRELLLDQPKCEAGLEKRVGRGGHGQQMGRTIHSRANVLKG